MIDYPKRYLQEVIKIADLVPVDKIDQMIETIVDVREKKGRLFFLGVGGSAANCAHAVNDFRKIAKIESYAPTDNVAELTARVNDDGWDTSFKNWLEVSNLTERDAVFVFSVGGGNKEKQISVNLIHALDHAKSKGSRILGIVSRDGGYTAQVADVAIVVPVINQDTITPHAEAWQGVLWHLVVSDPRVLRATNKWESVK